MRNFKRPRRKPLVAIDPLGNRFGYLKYDKDEVEELVDFTVAFAKRQAEQSF